MENAQSILDRVSVFFSELMGDQAAAPASVAPVAAEPVKMMDAKLKDGTVVQVTEMVVGGVVTIAGAPAPVGDIVLEDNTVVTIGDNGAIMGIEAPAVEAGEPPMVEDMNAKFAAFETATNDKFTAYESKFTAYEAKLSKANKVIEGLMQISKMLVEAPAVEPDASVKTSNAFNESKKSAKQAFDNFSNSICS